MIEPSKDLIDETEDLIGQIKAFQVANGRRIAKSIKRSRKSRAELAKLDKFGVPLPEDFVALYWNHNGTDNPLMPLWEEAVFLTFDWPPISSIRSGNEVARLRRNFPLSDRLSVFESIGAMGLDLAPALAVDGKVPLVANKGPLSERIFVAFDSTIDMLRSVCAAQDAGVITFEDDHPTFDYAELWSVIARFNPHSTYWKLMASGDLDWQKISVDVDNITIEPEIQKLISADLKRWVESGEMEAFLDGEEED